MRVFFGGPRHFATHPFGTCWRRGFQSLASCLLAFSSSMPIAYARAPFASGPSTMERFGTCPEQFKPPTLKWQTQLLRPLQVIPVYCLAWPLDILTRTTADPSFFSAFLIWKTSRPPGKQELTPVKLSCRSPNLRCLARCCVRQVEATQRFQPLAPWPTCKC